MTYTKTFLVGCVITTLFLQSNGRAIVSYSGSGSDSSGSDDVFGSGSYEVSGSDGSGSYEVADEVAGEVAGETIEVAVDINFGNATGNVTGNVTGNGSDDDEPYSSNTSVLVILCALSPLLCGGALCILLVLKCYLSDIIVPFFKKLKRRISNKLEERNLPIKNSKLNSKFVKKLNKGNLKQITAKAENTTLECTICIDDINLKDYERKKHSNKIVIPNCGHIYHTTCLNTWVRSQILNGQQPTCPTCRAVICDIPDTKSYTVYNASYDSGSDGYSSGGWLDDL